MGQQQLLLIVLGAIIVGIAVVVGINMMGSAADQANIDAVRQDVMHLASSAQQWYQKPVMMGGGGREYSGLDFNSISFPIDTMYTATRVENANGVYEITVNGQTIDVEAVALTAGDTLTPTIQNDGDVTDWNS